jgi:hypothetical protein
MEGRDRPTRLDIARDLHGAPKWRFRRSPLALALVRRGAIQ